VERSRPRWWRLALALPLTVASVACLAMSWQGIRGSHPAYGVTLLVVAVVGIVVILTAVRPRPVRTSGTAHAGDPAENSGTSGTSSTSSTSSTSGTSAAGESAGPPAERPAGRRVRTRTGRTLSAIGVLLLTVVLVWLQPFAAQGLDLASLGEGATVDVTTSFNRIDLAPTNRRAEVGLVFYPGARVDPQAYVPLLTRVAAQGYRVVIVKPPYGIPMLAPGAAGRIVDDGATVETWAVGGHSLGGVMAAQYVTKERPKVEALVLWASYPAGNLSGRQRLAVTSIYGTNDGLTTVAEIDASQADLPPSTQFVPIEGAVHAYFGDYGVQPGDGRPTVSRARAQDQIVEATVDALSHLGARSGG